MNLIKLSVVLNADSVKIRSVMSDEKTLEKHLNDITFIAVKYSQECIILTIHWTENCITFLENIYRLQAVGCICEINMNIQLFFPQLLKLLSDERYELRSHFLVKHVHSSNNTIKTKNRFLKIILNSRCKT